MNTPTLSLVALATIITTSFLGSAAKAHITDVENRFRLDSSSIGVESATVHCGFGCNGGARPEGQTRRVPRHADTGEHDLPSVKSFDWFETAVDGCFQPRYKSMLKQYNPYDSTFRRISTRQPRGDLNTGRSSEGERR